jgi:hypothetical protein
VAELKRQLILIVMLISIIVNQFGSFWRLKCVVYGVIIGVSFCGKFSHETHTHTHKIYSILSRCSIFKPKIEGNFGFWRNVTTFWWPPKFFATLFLFVENFGWFLKSCHQ